MFLLKVSIKHHINKYKDVYAAFFSILNIRLTYVDELIHRLEDTDLAYAINK